MVIWMTAWLNPHYNQWIFDLPFIHCPASLASAYSPGIQKCSWCPYVGSGIELLVTVYLTHSPGCTTFNWSTTLPLWASLTLPSVKFWSSLAMAFLMLIWGSSSSSLNDCKFISILQVVWRELGCVIHVPIEFMKGNFFDPFKSNKMWSYFTLSIHILTLISFPNPLNTLRSLEWCYDPTPEIIFKSCY